MILLDYTYYKYAIRFLNVFDMHHIFNLIIIGSELNFNKQRHMNQIFYVDFGENKRLKDFNLEIIYNRPTFTFCMLIWIQIIFFIHSSITGNGFQFGNEPLKTIDNFEFYRIFTAPFCNLGNLIDFLWLISSFWWMLSIFPLHVKYIYK